MTYAAEIGKGPPNDLQLEASRRRRASGIKQTSQPPPAKSPAPKPAKPPSPPPAKAAAAASAYPPLHKASAKVAAKTPAKAAKPPSPPPAAKAAPAAKGPEAKPKTGEAARDGGTYIDRSTDLAHWQTATTTKGYIHDQLSLRGYKTELSPSAWARVSKADLIKLIFSHPPQAEKP